MSIEQQKMRAKLKLLVGYPIEFTSLKTGRTVVATLLSFNDQHIQVKLLKQYETHTRTYFVDAIRLFDLDKIMDIAKTIKPEQPREYKEYKIRRKKWANKI